MCIINMSFSDEAIINFLLHETMKVERKEFEGQKRSNENDIIQHRRKLAQEHVCCLIPYYQNLFYHLSPIFIENEILLE